MIISKRRLVLFVPICLVLFFLSVLLYGHLWERKNVEETHLQWELPTWQGRSLTMVVLSDLHLRPEDGDYIDRIVARTLELQPDAILLLGDYYNGHLPQDSMEDAEMIRHLRPLTQRPCFAVLGNHDEYHGIAKSKQLLRDTGIPDVTGKSFALKIDGHQLRIGGVHCTVQFSRGATVPAPEAGVPFLLLSHSPDIIGHAKPGTDLILAGHTHGGQVCLPWGKPFGPDWFLGVPAKRSSGLVQEQGQSMYVSRGLGTSILPLRLFCRPELLVLHLTPGDASQPPEQK